MAGEPLTETAVVRRYFGTDGVRGITGEDLTVELVERLATAATIWSGSGRVFVGRDTRASGVELEQAFARGVVEAGGVAVLGGVLPTPAVARTIRPNTMGSRSSTITGASFPMRPSSRSRRS